ncbi:MAG TPA: hypothetical protein VJ754_05645, partial [Anaerolineae bacterium]|nr:hypothetical protein [Anaerolineae bacterium]
MAARTVVDTDLYWHLATGRIIVETGHIPRTDPFSSTRLGTPWVNVQWLPQIGLYLLYRSGGFGALSILVAALVTLGGVFVWRTMTGDVFLRAFGLILFAAASGLVWTPRPNILTFVLLAALGYILYLYRHRSIDRLWLIPPMFLVWVNLHGGYLIGFVLIGLTLAGDALDRLLGQAGPACMSWAGMRKLTIVTAVGALALVANLHGLDALLLPVQTVGMEASARWIMEWSSPDFHQISEQPMLWLLLLTLLAIGRSGRRMDLAEGLAVAGFAFLAFVSRRNIGLYAVVVTPICARYASAAIEHWRGSRPASPRHVGIGWLNALILIVVAALAALKVLVAVWPVEQAKAERNSMPVEAADWIEANRPGGLMFNSYDWGGYLIWRLWPDYLVYVDGRADVYGDEFLREYRTIALAEPGFESKLSEQNIRLVVVERESFLARQLTDVAGWMLAYSDERAVVYAR